MVFAMIRAFNNYGVDSPAGVCESAVCLWLKHIQQRIDKFNWGCSAGDYLPSGMEANNLYNQSYNNNDYKNGFLLYIQEHVFSFVAENVRDSDLRCDEHYEYDCCHFSLVIKDEGRVKQTKQWNELFNNMVRGDAVLLRLKNPHTYHTIGVYKGDKYFWIFDPNHGLYRGFLNTSFEENCADMADAVVLLSFGLSVHWDQCVCYGIHMRNEGGA